jgi:hypothetical protein
MKLRAMRNSVTAWVVVAGGVVVLKLWVNAGSMMRLTWASSWVMYGEWATRSVAPWIQILWVVLMVLSLNASTGQVFKPVWADRKFFQG